ncbi:Putative intracellular protease/amidase [Rhizobium sp. NFR07]|uniref:type 1 glutamine amidotransferase domain-containing protein n=1 Tax=Rhizobium sp. NFR07 TaxID=1566262 RepID=UPI0008F33E71|nr:type 1 glutamine amidotransferase domain-containing protein [Rhizobium sp. NFR07]SFB31403.1 Putative intracellular protease/amidase [Rhizobium sp. NFR07]
MSKGTILVAVSAADRIPLASGKLGKTGTYLNELVVPVMTAKDAGYDYVLATPTGTKPIIDEVSAAAGHFGNDEAAFEKAAAFFDNDPAMQKPKTLKAVVAEGLENYVAVFVPGGQAPIVDMAQDEDFGKILRYFHEHSKPTALLCHGPIALTAALTEMKTFRKAMETGDITAAKAAAAKGWPYTGYRMTIFTNEEEKYIEDEILHDKMQFHVVDALQAAGGLVSRSERDFQPYVVHDRELITGQNPRSDHQLAETLLKAIADAPSSARVA